jgi:LmbE family N-acetylglucosaminyl deacetylase
MDNNDKVKDESLTPQPLEQTNQPMPLAQGEDIDEVSDRKVIDESLTPQRWDQPNVEGVLAQGEDIDEAPGDEQEFEYEDEEIEEEEQPLEEYLGLAENEPLRVLVVCAHPDDAEFGAAGTVAAWAKAGREVYYAIITRGDKGSGDPEMTSERLAQIREREQREAAAVLGVKEVVFLGFRDGELVADLTLRGAITRAIRQFRPHILITQDPTALFYNNRFINHPDHRAAGLATVDAVYPTARDHLQFPKQLAEGLQPHKVAEVFLIQSEEPDILVDISETIETKIAALQKHASQFEDANALGERVRERAKELGEQGGMDYAEAFRRIIIRR